MKRWVAAAALVTVVVPVAASGDAGDIDHSFGEDGLARVGFGTGRQDDPGGVAVARDGAIVVAGTSRRARGEGDLAIARLTPSGRLDRSFSRDGRTLVDFGGDEHLAGVVVQRDGRVIVAGTTTTRVRTSSGDPLLNTVERTAPPASQFALARLDRDGTLDESFGVGGRILADVVGDGTPAVATAVALERDGDVVVAGNVLARTDAAAGPAQATVGSGTFVLARYTPAGLPDPTFGAGGRVLLKATDGVDVIRGIAITSTGVVAVGSTRGPGRSEDFLIVGLLPNGALDPTFASAGVLRIPIHRTAADRATSVATGPDGNLVVAGTAMGRRNHEFAVVRVGRDGRVLWRNVWASAAAGRLGDYGAAVAVQRDGKILVGGSAETRCYVEEGLEPEDSRTFCEQRAALVRMTPRAWRDRSFGTEGGVILPELDEPGLVALQGPRPIVVGQTLGGFSDFGLVRLLAG